MPNDDDDDDDDAKSVAVWANGSEWDRERESQAILFSKKIYRGWWLSPIGGISRAIFIFFSLLCQNNTCDPFFERFACVECMRK